MALEPEQVEERICQACAQVFKDLNEANVRRDEEQQRQKRELQDQITCLQLAASHKHDAAQKDSVISNQSKRIQELERANGRLRSERDEFIQKHAELSGKHSNAKKQASENRKAFEFYRDKYHASKETVHRWQQWVKLATPPVRSSPDVLRRNSNHESTTENNRLLTPPFSILLGNIHSLRSAIKNTSLWQMF